MKYKWSNIQKSFRRELRKQRSKKSGDMYVKRKQYIYFTHLTFLLPTMEDRATVSECNLLEDEEEICCNRGGSTAWDTRSTRGIPRHSRNRPITCKCKFKRAWAIYEAKIKKTKGESYEESLSLLSEKKSFLLSILQAMQKLGALLKMKLKLEFLEALMLHSESECRINQTQTNPRYHPYNNPAPQESFPPIYPTTASVTSFPHSSMVNRPSCSNPSRHASSLL